MNKIKRENLFLIIWFCCTMFLVGVCNLGFIRGTMAGFGNMTGQLTAAYVIEYSSNYPSELGISDEFKREAIVSQNYIIKDNQFVLDGYEFLGWNSSDDGLGDVYLVNDIILLEKNITLYAQWKKIEVVMIAYGDVNLNGVIDEEDYSLIEKSISDGILLEGQALLNADCNNDGKVDLVDVDIIKQAILGTEGYSDSLPNKPILKYEIYVSEGTLDSDNNEDENVDKPSVDDGNETTDDDNNNSGNNSGGSSGTSSGNGTGSSGSGSSSSGSGGNKKPSSGGSSSNNKKPNSNNGSSSGGNQDDSTSKEEDKNNVEITDKEEDKNVGDVPNNGNSNKNNIIVNKKSNGKSYVWIIVILMCFISLRLILYVINRFRKSENNKDE